MRVYEQKVIGGIVSGVVTPSAITLSLSDFEDDDYAKILTIARQLESSGTPIDADILALRLCDTDAGFLNRDDLQLMAQAVKSASVVYEAVEKLKTASLKTKLLSETSAIALKQNATAAELLSDLKAVVEAAEYGYRTAENSFVYLKDLARPTAAVVDDLFRNVSYSISTGFSSFDDLMADGFSRGDSHIIVGFTGSGKTALALQIAKNQAEAGIVVGIVSREMSATENHLRLLANRANVARSSIRKGMPDSIRRNLLVEIEKTASLPIAFDTHTSNIEDLRPRVREMVERDGMGILYVDYLQLMTSRLTGSNRANEVQTISRTLKLIAMENKIPVVSLCQFNRGAMSATLFDILGHLKESSGIEQDASTISYVQIERTEEIKSVKEAKVTILKNRNGATFQSVNFDYNGAVFRFSEKFDASNDQKKYLLKSC